MADLYTKIRHAICGRGGLKCPCCNPKAFAGTSKNRKRATRATNKRARTRMKQDYEERE